MTARERTPSGEDRSQPTTPRGPDGKSLQDKGGPGAFTSLGLLIGLGTELAASVAVTFFLGWYLDGKWGTAPWMMLVLTTFGAGGGMYNFIRTVTKVSKEESRQKEGGPR
jgi:ATP synthase protein I